MKQSFSFEQGSIRLRAPEPHDIDLLYNWENDPGIWRFSNTLLPFSRHKIEEFVLNSGTDIFQTKQARWMIEFEDGTDTGTIGSIDLFDYDPIHKRAGVGILIRDKAMRNKGYAGTALKILIDYSLNILSLHQLYCNISSDNKASLALFKKYGFEISGTRKDWLFYNEEWMDEYFLQLILK